MNLGIAYIAQPSMQPSWLRAYVNDWRVFFYRTRGDMQLTAAEVAATGGPFSKYDSHSAETCKHRARLWLQARERGE